MRLLPASEIHLQDVQRVSPRHPFCLAEDDGSVDLLRALAPLSKHALPLP